MLSIITQNIIVILFIWILIMAMLLYKLIKSSSKIRYQKEQMHIIEKERGFFEEFSVFQTDVIKNLSKKCTDLLSLITKYFNSDKGLLIKKVADKIQIIVYSNEDDTFKTEEVEISEGINGLFDAKVDLKLSFKSLPVEIQNIIKNSYKIDGKIKMGISLCCNNNMDGLQYAVLLTNTTKASDIIYENDKSIITVLKMCVENSILREKIIWDSEHDASTQLYNKNKYLSSLIDYNLYKSVGVIYFDVNNLKYVNDNLGHALGDRLIQKASKSIKYITSDNVKGYRVGGDEFVVIATDLTETELHNIHKKWENKLKQLNTDDTTINCVVASGMAYQRGLVDIKSVVKQADSNMYLDKQRKKENKNDG